MKKSSCWSVRASALASESAAVIGLAERINDSGRFEVELKREQAELASSPAETLRDLESDLRRLRRELTIASAGHGIQPMPLAANPLETDSSTSDNERYRRMNDQFGIVARDQLTCGMHVHVSIGSREKALPSSTGSGPG